MQSLLRLDSTVTTAIQSLELGQLDRLLLPGAVLFGYAGIGPVLVGAAFVGGRDTVATATMSCALGCLFIRAVKIWLQRRRPSVPTDVVRIVRCKVPPPDDKDGAAFPSGDTMSAAVVGVSLAFGGSNALWAALGMYAGFARVYFWCHFVSDVIGGYMFGVASVAIVSTLSNQGRSIMWWHVAAALPPFVLLMKMLSKLQAKAVRRNGS